MTYYYYLGGLLYFVGHGKILHNNNIMLIDVGGIMTLGPSPIVTL
jgi:hypothetical protein